MGLLLVGVALVAGSRLSDPEVARASTVSVSITPTGFSPANVTISTGDTITWTNNTSTTQTASAQIAGTDPNFFNSNFIYAGDSWSHTFTSAGTVNYRSNTTPSFTGTITVTSGGGGGSTPPTHTPTSSGGGSGGGVAVSITSSGFAPASLNIPVGTTVTWTNNTSTTQTASAQIAGTDPNFFNSNFIYAGDSWSHTFTSAGTVNYRSNTTPAFTGTITIGGGGGGGGGPTAVSTSTKTPTPAMSATPTGSTLTPGPTQSPSPPSGKTATPTKTTSPSPTATPSPSNNRVAITNSAFVPQSISVAVGTTVTWTNTTATAKTANWVSGPAMFFSGFIYGGKAWSHTFTVPGVYTYKSVQGSFTGTVIVGGGGGGGSSLPFSPMGLGWNLTTYGGTDGAPSQALAQLGNQYTAVYYWDGARWYRYFRPGVAPSFLNTITNVSTGQPLWILATASIP